MVSPVFKLFRGGRDGDHQRMQPTRTIERKRRTPLGATPVVSPTESSGKDTPLEVTPTRRKLFEKTPAQITVVGSQHSELEELRTANKRKDQQLRVLHERFTHIEQGLDSIDQERNALVEKTKRLEKEKKTIQTQLELREREILALVKRCASQEDKMRESSTLRAANRGLYESLEDVQGKLDAIQGESDDVRSLRRKLQDSELARERLQDELAKVQREYDYAADTLQGCLVNIKKLTEEKELVEEERRRERRRAEIQFEKQHLEHVQASNDLKEDIETKQQQIFQMENIIQENMFSNTSLRREKAIQSEEQQVAIASIVADYENKLSNLQQQFENAIHEKAEKLAKELELSRGEIWEKEAVIVRFKEELDEAMQLLMGKQTLLDESEDSRRKLEGKVEKLEAIECNHSAQKELIDILESNLVDVTSENALLVVERDDLRLECCELHQRLGSKRKQPRANTNHNHEPNKESDSNTISRPVDREEERKTDDKEEYEAREVDLLSEQLRSLEKLNASMVADRDGTDVHIELLRKQVESGESQIVMHEKEIEALTRRIEQSDQRLSTASKQSEIELATARGTITMLKEKMDLRTLELKEALEEAHASLNCMQAEKLTTDEAHRVDSIAKEGLEREIEAKNKNAMELKEDLHRSVKACESVQSELTALRQRVFDRDEEISTTIAKKDRCIDHMSADLSESQLMLEKSSEALFSTKRQLLDCQRISQDGADQLAFQAERVSSLEAALNDSKQECESLRIKCQHDTSRFEVLICELRTENALKDGEIRDLRLVDLEDAEDKILMLTKELETMKETLRHDGGPEDQKSRATLESINRDLKDRLDMQAGVLEENQKLLEERSALLRDMVLHNNSLESKLTEQQDQITNLKQSLNAHREHISANKENTINRKFEPEHQRKVSTEGMVANQQRQCEVAEQKGADLEKLNFGLQSKLDLQETPDRTNKTHRQTPLKNTGRRLGMPGRTTPTPKKKTSPSAGGIMRSVAKKFASSRKETPASSGIPAPKNRSKMFGLTPKTKIERGKEKK